MVRGNGYRHLGLALPQALLRGVDHRPLGLHLELTQERDSHRDAEEEVEGEPRLPQLRLARDPSLPAVRPDPVHDLADLGRGIFEKALELPESDIGTMSVLASRASAMTPSTVATNPSGSSTCRSDRSLKPPPEA